LTYVLDRHNVNKAVSFRVPSTNEIVSFREYEKEGVFIDALLKSKNSFLNHVTSFNSPRKEVNVVQLMAKHGVALAAERGPFNLYFHPQLVACVNILIPHGIPYYSERFLDLKDVVALELKMKGGTFGEYRADGKVEFFPLNKGGKKVYM